MKNHVINLVNFVRGCEPRKKNWDLYTPAVEEIRINRENGLSSTFLLQYDAMLRKDFQELFLRERGDDLELGVWFEMGRALTESCGIEWRGRAGYDWDWYVNPGFLLAYTPDEREKLIDEVFRLFKEIFGNYPRVVGSWLLDAHSLAYMSDKYEIDAFTVCREQYAVDAYTLWGGYYSGGYYPSRNNMICPAQHKETQINTPVFRMLGIDPIYGYDESKHDPKLGGCYTMEPYWPSGSNEEVMDWYFRSYFTTPSLALSHATTGQENSFKWEKVEAGYRLQIALIKKYAAEGHVRCETLGKTGRDFKAAHADTPAAVLSALDDWSGNGLQSVWYSCKNYRADLFYKDGSLFFRDIQKFDDRLCEDHLKTPCTAWQAFYENLPVVDNRIGSDETRTSELRIEQHAIGIEALRELSACVLEVTVRFADGQVGTVVFDERGIAFSNCGVMIYSSGCGEIFRSVKDGVLSYSYRETDYTVEISADMAEETTGVIRLLPKNGEVYLTLALDQ